MARVPTSGIMLDGPHRRRRYTKPAEPVESPETEPVVETPAEPVESPETEPVVETPAEPVESPETGTSDAQEVPRDLTKVADLLDWVGDNKTRAQAVLDQENAKSESEVRVTLVSKLTSILEADLI